MMRDLVRWDPFRELNALGTTELEFVPSFEVKETSDAYVFKADLPGIKESNLDVSLTGNRLTVAGKREEEKEEQDARYHAYERSYGSFSRSFTLPEGADTENAQAELKDGVLTITLAKKPEVKPRKIQLKRLSSGTAEKAQA